VTLEVRRQIARKAKSIVALAFRNGPIEQLKAGRPCPTCAEDASFSRISDDEMKTVMKNAVSRLYALLLLKAENAQEYERQLQFGDLYTRRWDDPESLATTTN
jgi:hypothetical protein